MKVLMFLHGFLPYPSGTGSSVMTWAIATGFKECGNNIAVCSYGSSKSLWNDKAKQELRRYGIGLHLLPASEPNLTRSQRLRRALLARLEDFYPITLNKDDVITLLRKERPDIVYLYGEAFFLSQAIPQSFPRVISLVDSPIDSLRARRRFKGYGSRLHVIYAVLDALAERNLHKITLSLVRHCNLLIVHAAHHAEFFRQCGVQCTYVPNPVRDPFGGSGFVRRRTQIGREKLKISLIGHLSGVCTIAGLRYLMDNILPIIPKSSEDLFEFHVIGGGRLPTKISSALERHPLVRMRGYVHDIRSEFQSSDILLVPTPITLGFRTRIAEGFAYGCAVVSHEANKAGMPELQSMENCILCSRPEEFVRAFDILRRDDQVYERLCLNARKTFEENYSERVVVAKMNKMFASLLP